MARRPWPLAFIILLLSLLCIVGCSSSGASEAEEEQLASLAFSEVQVTCERHDGWFGARGASFKVTGSVKNNTEDPVNEDNLPSIESADSDERYEPEITQDKLLAGETCDFTYEGEVDVRDGEVPTLSFEGSFDFGGLEDAEVELNTGVKAVADEYAAEDAGRIAEEQKTKEEKEAAEAKKKQDRADLEGCKGKAADEALNVAKRTDYEYRFLDDFDVDVTDDVKTPSNGSDVHKAEVLKVEVDEGGWLSDPSVTFRLDYVDPAAAKERADEAQQKAEEEERRQKEQEDKDAAEAKKREDRKNLEACEGKAAADALAVARDTDYPFQFVDNYGVDVTDALKKAEKEAAEQAEAAKETAAKEAAAKEDADSEKGDTKDEEGATRDDSDDNSVSAKEDSTEQKDSAQATETEAATEGPAAEQKGDAKETPADGQPSESKGEDKAEDAEDKADGKPEKEDATPKQDAKSDTKAEGKESKSDSKAAKDEGATSENAKLLGAKVTKVEVSEDGFFSNAGVKLHLDYTDPEGEKERLAKLPTATFSDWEYDIQLEPSDSGDSYSLVARVRGELKVVAPKDGDANTVSTTDLPELNVKADKETNTAAISCFDRSDSDGADFLEVGEDYSFLYRFAVLKEEKNPTYAFSFKKHEGVNVKGLDKKLLAEMEKQFNERMGNLDAEIAEREEQERQREEQERIEAEERAAQERAEAEERARQEEAEREQQRANAEAERRARGCYVTQTGNCYHTDPGCPSIKNSYDLIGMTVGEAEDQGLSKCGRCRF